MKDTMIGVDLAKTAFQVHGATMTGDLKFRRKLTRSQFRQFMSGQSSAVVVMEARQLQLLGARDDQAMR